MKVLLATILLLLMKYSMSQETNGIYTIVCESTLQAGSKFRIYVTVHNGSTPVQLTAKLGSESGEQNPNEIGKTFSLNAQKGASVDMDIPLNWTDGYYNLELSGSGGAIFKHQKELYLTSLIQRFVIKIMMDKEIYSPGDVVRFSALIIDEKGKAINDGEVVKVAIKTKAGSLVKEWLNAPTQRGVFWTEFHLDEHCDKGELVVIVNYKGITNKFPFYIPDQGDNFIQNSLFFDVEIVGPKAINLNDSQVTVEIEAIYKCGHKVNGSLNLKLYGKYCLPDKDCGPWNLLEDKPIYGLIEEKIDLPSLLGFADWYLEATVKDRLTSRIRQTTKPLKIQEFHNDVEIQLLHKYFNPGLQFQFYVRANQENNHQQALDQQEVEVRIEYLVEDAEIGKSTIDETHKILLDPENTRAKLTVNVPKDAYDMTILLSSKNESTTAVQHVLPVPYNSKTKSLTILVDDLRVKVGSVVNAQIFTTTNVSILTYHIVSIRSYEIIESGTSAVPAGENIHWISFPVTADAVTHFYFIVYGVTSDGLLVADSRVFVTTLANPVDISLNASPLIVEPNAPINFTIKADPNTRLFLKSFDSVLDRLLETFYNPASWTVKFDAEWSYWKNIEESELSVIQWQIGFSNSSHKQSALFKVPRLVLFTNCFLQNEFNQSYRIPPDNNHQGDKENEWKVKPRRDFSPVWLWKNLTVGSEGELTFSTTAPDQISTWYTNIYGIDEKQRIGFLKGPTIKVTKPLFVLLDLPQSLIRSEAVQIRILVFRETFQQVNITLVSKNETFQILDEETHRVITNSSLTKTILKTGDLIQAISFLISPLYTGPLDVEVIVTSEVVNSTDAVIRQIDVKERPSSLQPIVYDSNDALRHGEVFCAAQLRKSHTPFSSDRLNISFQVNSLHDELGHLILNACVRYLNSNESDIILEAELPTGYEFMENIYSDVSNNSTTTPFSHFEVSENNSKIKWFFNKIPDDFICVSAKAKRIFIVYNLQAAKVTAYTSVDLLRAKRAIVYYRAPSLDSF